MTDAGWFAPPQTKRSAPRSHYFETQPDGSGQSVCREYPYLKAEDVARLTSRPVGVRGCATCCRWLQRHTLGAVDL